LTKPSPGSHISDSAQIEVDRLREAFLAAKPFKHIAIENFFEPAFAERLLAEFPNFDRDLAKNETGGTGGKSVNTRIREISPAYQELYDTLGSQPFLDYVSRLSGIPDLILDPKMFGGGTHDNQHGQELDSHVDFNYDEARQLHRRLNLIVYLNKEWETEWGGAIEIHSNPRDPFSNQVRGFDPLFNRCVMFETNEYSWHGFPKIDLPPEKRHLSRKSISIYLYTKDRPAEEVAPVHGTFYVQRFLPNHFSPGATLTEEDVKDLQRLLIRRDGWIEFYQKMELEKNRLLAEKETAIQDLLAVRDEWIELYRKMEAGKNSELAHLESAVQDLRSHVRAPLVGYAMQEEKPAGIYSDDWVSPHAEIAIRPIEPVASITVRGWRPEDAPEGNVSLSAGPAATAAAPVRGGFFEVAIKFPQPVSQTFRLAIDVQSPGNGLPSSGDRRDLAFRLAEIRTAHPPKGLLGKILS